MATTTPPREVGASALRHDVHAPDLSRPVTKRDTPPERGRGRRTRAGPESATSGPRPTRSVRRDRAAVPRLVALVAGRARPARAVCSRSVRRRSSCGDDTLRAVAELRPVALPPAERTRRPARRRVGAFLRRPLLAVARARRRRRPSVAVVFADSLPAAPARPRADRRRGACQRRLSLRACSFSTGLPPRARLVAAWPSRPWLVFAPAPFLVLGSVVPGSDSGSLRSVLALVLVLAIPWRRRARVGTPRSRRAWIALARARLRPRRSARFLTLPFTVICSRSPFLGSPARLRRQRRLGRARVGERRALAAPLHRDGAALRRPGGAGVISPQPRLGGRMPIVPVLSRVSQKGVQTLQSNPGRCRR